MNSSNFAQITDMHKSVSENIRRLSVRVLQLESLVTIQSEIINYLSNNGHIDKDHPLFNVSKEIQRSLIPISGMEIFNVDRTYYQNMSDSKFSV